ncbi:hypothetical protein [Metabacillus fastidiosus]|uniref:hypothetical protein n=1 Tax=Metabacillus fastidiosus TaxID=1458 RepID=UPI003D2D6F92
MKSVTVEYVRNILNEGGSWKGYVASSEFTAEQIVKGSKIPSKYSSSEMLERVIDSEQRYLTDRNSHEVVLWEVNRSEL